jgi:heptosyltransferase-2
LPCFTIRNALVLRGGALGDFILTLPIIHALECEFSTRKAERPHEPPVNVVVNRKLADLGADKRFALDDPDLARFFTANADLPPRWRRLFAEHDLILSYLHDPNRIFEENVRRCGVENFIAGPHRIESGSHATAQLARPLVQLGIPIVDFAPQIELSESERKIARANFERPLIALHPGSGSRRKNWPIENWITLIDDLLVSRQRVIMIGGEADEKEIALIRDKFADRVSYAVNWPLRQIAAFLSGIRFVGHDSGISHLAAAAGARCVILLGASDPTVWTPQNQNVRVVIAPENNLHRLKLSAVRGALAL